MVRGIGAKTVINWEVIQGDCLDVMAGLPDDSVDCAVIDPPYNINKDSWDTIVNYEAWMQSVFLQLQRVLKDNGSLYWFHSEMRIIADWMRFLDSGTAFIFRQFITWNKRFAGSKNKGFLDGYVAVDDLRNYQQMAEYILYYTFQDETGLSKVLPHCVYPIREYIRAEIIRAKGRISLQEINSILGTATNGGGVASATLSLDKACPAMITKTNYETLREWLNSDGGEFLRQEYESLRYVFNNQKTHHSVWNYEIEDKIGHVTPKPVRLIQNILRHSTNRGQTVLDCFLGSGTTGVACAIEGRNFIGIEQDAHYCDVARARITRACGEYAEIPKRQAPEVILPLFAEVAA